jgi:hypothetical protein
MPHNHQTSPATRATWDAWQARTPHGTSLTHEAKREGYTVVRVDPASRELFLELVQVLNAYGRFQRHEHPNPLVQDTCQAWRLGTQQVLKLLQDATAQKEAPDASTDH